MQNVDAISTDFIEPKKNYLNNGTTLKSWLLTKDHKRIAIMYLVTVSLFFMAGGLYAATIRLELLTPESDLLNTQTYNKVFTTHGILMIFFFLIPAIPAVLGNFFLPIMIGAKDLALPRINLLSLYTGSLVGSPFGRSFRAASIPDGHFTFRTARRSQILM
jgi:cytochrome c oxidase subunit 1